VSENIHKMVLLLALFQKLPDETTKDVLNKLENSGAIDRHRGKQLMTELKRQKLYIDDSLTFVGIEQAKKAEKFFKI